MLIYLFKPWEFSLIPLIIISFHINNSTNWSSQARAMFADRYNRFLLLPLLQLLFISMITVVAIQDDSRIIRMTNPFAVDDDNDHNHNLLSRSSFSSSSSKKLFANSPMFYLKLKSTANALLQHQQQQHRYPSSTFTTNNNNEMTSVRRKNSNIYKLPLKFVSNGKPVQIKGNYYLFCWILSIMFSSSSP